jgi:hypothetical protein
MENMTEEGRRIAWTRIDADVFVSTIWLGIDQRFGEDGPPLIFETMIFGGPLDSWCERSSTEAEAVALHALAVIEATAAEYERTEP